MYYYTISETEGGFSSGLETVPDGATLITEEEYNEIVNNLMVEVPAEETE